MAIPKGFERSKWGEGIIEAVAEGPAQGLVMNDGKVELCSHRVDEDAALEQADVILMHDKIDNVEEAVRLSRRARAIIRQNIVISLGVIFVLIVSALLEKINLTVGVIGHEGSTVVVVLNGLRLLRRDHF